MIEGGEELLGLGVIAAALEGECALAGVGEEIIEGDGVHGGGVEEVGAFEAGHGEDDGVEFAGLLFSDAGVDVAADIFDLKIGAEGEELGFAAEGAGADFGALGEIGDGFGGGGDENIADIFALGDGGDDEIGLIDEGHGDRDILEAVDDEVDFVVEKRLFELADEEAFAAEFVEGAVGDLVAGGFEDLGFDVDGAMLAEEGIDDELALGAGESGTAGAEAEGWGVGVGLT